MARRTISLELAVYERLRAAKRAGETFSQTVSRLVPGTRPSFRVLAGILSDREAIAVRSAIFEMRAREARGVQARLGSVAPGRIPRGSRH
jgi:predicted CopG family antitoxin